MSIEKYKIFKESPEFSDLLSTFEAISELKTLNLGAMFNLGFDAAHFYTMLQNRPDVIQSITPKDVKFIQNKLAELLKAITNFQSGFSKGFQSAQDACISKKYYKEDP